MSKTAQGELAPDRLAQRSNRQTDGHRATTGSKGVENEPPSSQAASDRRGASSKIPKSPFTPRLILIATSIERKSGVGLAYAKKEWGLSNPKANEIVKSVGSWKAFTQELQKHEEIGHLVLVFHGGPGDLELNNDIKTLVGITKLFSKPLPRVNRIYIEGCRVAAKPDTLYKFGLAFNASMVTGFNHYWGHNVFNFKVESGAKIETIQAFLTSYDRYFFENPPSAEEVFNRKGAHSFLVEWFRSENFRHVEKKAQLPPLAPGEQDLRGDIFEPRSSAVRKEITNEKQAIALGTEYENGEINSLHHVVVILPAIT